jgi:carbonic anhydrase
MTQYTTTTRREILKAIPVVGAAGALLALDCRPAKAVSPTMTRAAQREMTPEEAIDALKKGNERFVSGKMVKRDLMDQVHATASGQFPFAVVLGCIDSRVPPELVFDQGIGDIFSPRIAGNFANTDIIGSIEFATALAGAKAIVVLGHTECGAIKGACDHARLGNLTHTLSNLEPAVAAVAKADGPGSSKDKGFVQKVAEKNVRLTMKGLTQRSPILRDLVANKQLKIVGAMHDVGTGRVTFLPPGAGAG